MASSIGPPAAPTGVAALGAINFKSAALSRSSRTIRSATLPDPWNRIQPGHILASDRSDQFVGRKVGENAEGQFGSHMLDQHQKIEGALFSGADKAIELPGIFAYHLSDFEHHWAARRRQPIIGAERNRDLVSDPTGFDYHPPRFAHLQLAVQVYETNPNLTDAGLYQKRDRPHRSRPFDQPTRRGATRDWLSVGLLYWLAGFNSRRGACAFSETGL